MSRASVGGWSGLGEDEVQEKLQVHSCQSRALRCIAPGVDSETSGSDEIEESLAQKECRTDFPEMSLQLQDPSEWTFTTCGGFFREEYTILEARSI